MRTTHYARTLKRWVQCHAARLRGDCGLQVRLILDSGGADGWGRAFVRAHSRELRRLAPGAGPALDELDHFNAGRWLQLVERALTARQGSQASGGFAGVLTTDQSWLLHGDPPPISFPLALATVVERVLSRPIGDEREIWE